MQSAVLWAATVIPQGQDCSKGRGTFAFLAMSRPESKRPWPMKWVVLAIIAILLPYTAITLLYRKESRPFEPYSDMKRQANVHRLLKAGFNRYLVTTDRPTEGLTPIPAARRAVMQAAPGGVPQALADALIEVPHLPSTVRQLAAPVSVRAGEALVVFLVAGLPDHKEALGETYLYVRDSELILLVGFDPLPGKLESRARDLALRASVSTEHLKPGRYRLTVVGLRESQVGTVTVVP